MSSEIAIELMGVSKRFGSTAALENLTLTVIEGEFHTILGPSGSGKTTALRVIAGFERPDTGKVRIAGREVAGTYVDMAPELRRVGMVFQEFALFPHMTVRANIGYGVPDPSARRRRTSELLEMVGMAGYEKRFPHELSGGQQQRVAVARALAPEPRVILLDEPFSNLDASLRRRVRSEIKAILDEAHTSTLFVTHDQEEALSLSDQVSVMREGTLVQVATPGELYRRPIDAWTARFLGEADFLQGEASGGVARTTLGTFSTTHSGAVTVMVRPERVVLVPGQQGEIVKREFFGHDQLVTVKLENGEFLRSRLGPVPAFSTGERVGVKIEEAVVYPALSA